MKSNQEKFQEEFNELLEEVDKKNKQTEIDYPEFPEEQRQGLDAGNPVLRRKLMENSRWAVAEINKLKEKYGIKNK